MMIFNINAMIERLVILLHDGPDRSIATLNVAFDCDFICVVIVQGDRVAYVVCVDNRVVNWLEAIDDIEAWGWSCGLLSSPLVR
jgi:hypothetical protein